MKTAHDPRHIRRIRAVKALFSNTFHPEQEPKSKLAKKVISQQQEIDDVIVKCAPEWPLSQINRLDLSVLRLAVFEMLNKQSTPPKVIIDEAIEIGKRYGSQSSGGFINGVLASALKATKRDKDIDTDEEQTAAKNKKMAAKNQQSKKTDDQQ